jgi:chromate transporter
MNFLLLYLLFLKASVSSFSGLASLPIIREDLVVKRHLLTDRDLNTAVVIGRTTPGPKGLYIISVGQYAGGFAGATAAWLAIVTPALLVIPLLEFAGRRADHPKVKQVLRAVVLASAGISLSATLPLAADALHGWLSYAIALAALIALLVTEVDTLWVIFGAGLLAVLAHSLGASGSM